MTYRMTAEEYRDLMARQGKTVHTPPYVVKPAARPDRAVGRMKAGKMNRTESAYALQLEARKVAGEIAWYAFEEIKLRLADRTFYTPDFFVMLSDGTFEVHEVKGHWEEDARVKVKVAARLFPFRFLIIKPRSRRLDGGFDVKDVADGL